MISPRLLRGIARSAGPCRRRSRRSSRSELVLGVSRSDPCRPQRRPDGSASSPCAPSPIGAEDTARDPGRAFIEIAQRRDARIRPSRRSSGLAGWARARPPERLRRSDGRPRSAGRATSRSRHWSHSSAVAACLGRAQPGDAEPCTLSTPRALQGMHNVEGRRGPDRSAANPPTHPSAARVHGALPARPPRSRLHRRLVDHPARYQRSVLQAGRLGPDGEDRAGPGRGPEARRLPGRQRGS